MKRLLLFTLFAQPAQALDIDPFVVWTHGSDLFRGEPFNDRREWSYDHVGAGVTLTAGSFEVDVTHGVKSYSRRRIESGTNLAIRYYWRRNKARTH